MVVPRTNSSTTIIGLCQPECAVLDRKLVRQPVDLVRTSEGKLRHHLCDRALYMNPSTHRAKIVARKSRLELLDSGQRQTPL
ncbi:hypothetical protein BQ8794_140043 [Mesorhizobium prunaredense]|uniref:Uncharacterized protein n=1 Tax=Mesorhizobium prunaredense TaxID=1631249 RepID=A0A1R3V3V4_9HYPH|nr:hypothetical protein BQ8794_140043 [Mesorhizobium prunaredense]